MTYPLFIQTSCTLLWSLCLTADWLKWQKRLKATKPEKWHFLTSCSPLLNCFKKNLSSPGVKLDLGSVKCLRVWPSPGVACHIQLWAPNRKALTHLSLFSYYSTSTSIKNTSPFRKILWALESCCFAFGRFAASLHQTVAAFVWGVDERGNTDVELFSQCFLHTLESRVTPFLSHFWFFFIPQMAFRWRDIPTEMHWLHNLKQQQQNKKTEQERRGQSLSLSLSASSLSGCWSLI